MPRMESAIFKSKFEKKTMSVALDDNDPIHISLRKALEENNVREAKVIDVSGKLKEGTVQYMQGTNLKNKDLRETELMHASGHLKVSFGELFGTIKVSTKSKPMYSGTLLGGKAGQGLTFKLSFAEEKSDQKKEIIA